MPAKTKKHTSKESSAGAQAGDVSVVLAGEAGQGIQSIETILVNIMKRSGYDVFATKEYMSRVRGGINSTQIRISGARVSAFIERTDILICLDKDAPAHLKGRIQKSTLIVAEKEMMAGADVVDVPFTKIASELGDPVYASMVAVGLVCGLIGSSEEAVREFIGKQFARKGPDVVEKNMRAYSKGLLEASRIASERKIGFHIAKSPGVANELLLSGADAAALGAIAGGCDAVFAYPMTPSTGVFTALAGYASKAGLAVEQVEDEIGVINMALGAWYAGARALVTTAGGGFSLMTEGISLSGMTESPVVVLVSQRPGPATGLPTRTEQGDLDLVLYAGHGVFPRVILAPGDTMQAFELSRKAFDIADRFQIPVFILTDQYLVDSYYNIPEIVIPDGKIGKHIVSAAAGYKRYALTADGLSPRGVPGFGSGTVCVDSDEHDEEGRITEDLAGISLEMKKKRLKKFKPVETAAIAPELFGPKSYKTLFVGWGSVKAAALEALGMSGLKDAAFLHFSQVWPVPKIAASYLRKAKKIVMIENNQTSQFGELLKRQTGIEIDARILRYDGMPFSADGLSREIAKAGGKRK